MTRVECKILVWFFSEPDRCVIIFGIRVTFLLIEMEDFFLILFSGGVCEVVLGFR